jgi:superfamily II DNA/RNA helicase
MDFERFGIDPRLARAAESLKASFFVHEKLLSHAIEKAENVCVKLSLAEGREEVILLPALQWLLSGESRKALVVVPDDGCGERFAQEAARLGAEAGIGACRVATGADGSTLLEGDPGAPVLIGRPDALQSVPGLSLRDFGFLVVDGAERIAELDAESIRKFVGLLLPSWERRSLLACEKLSAKAKNLAWDLADNPAEISIEGESAKAESVVKETWQVADGSKMKFLLGILGRESSERVCIFCNLRDSADELSRRLEANGLKSDSMLGALAAERKFAVLERVRSGELRCLVLTDQGAEDLDTGVFPLVINFDIPLEPELFVKRLEMLDRSAPGAKLVNIACDRYIVGLGAVESYINAKLDALPVDESMLAPVDRSEGMSFGRRREGAQSRGDGRRGPSPRQEPQRRQGGQGQRQDGRQQGGNRQGGNRQGAYPRDAYPREDRSPDIRKSISEATGGALDMSADNPPPRPPRNGSQNGSQNGSRRGNPQDKRGPRPEQRRDGGRQGGQGRPGERSANRSGGRADNRGPSRQDNRAKPQAPRGNPPKPAQRQGNPYDMPVEERMRLYKEKYGKGLGEKNPRQGQSRGGSPKPPAPQAAPAQPRPEPRGEADKGPGLFGRLFGSRKTKE